MIVEGLPYFAFPEKMKQMVLVMIATSRGCPTSIWRGFDVSWAGGCLFRKEPFVMALMLKRSFMILIETVL